MATYTPNTAVRIDRSSQLVAGQVTRVAGEAIFAGAACYVKSDNKIYLSNGTANDANAKFDGFAEDDAIAGEAVTIWNGPVVFGNYMAAALVIGAPLYVSATAGKLDSAATTGGLVAIAKVYADPLGTGTCIRCISLGTI